MKLEFYGTYKSFSVKKTKTDKDYIELICNEQMNNKDVKICVFGNKFLENLKLFNDGDGIVIIFSYWYDKKSKNNVLIVKDIISVDG